VVGDDPAWQKENVMRKKKAVIVDQRRVIVDTRHASLDRRLPIEDVRIRYAMGHLIFDCTNGQYALPENGKVPTWMMHYPRW
jgi:hypothetical protein